MSTREAKAYSDGDSCESRALPELTATGLA